MAAVCEAWSAISLEQDVVSDEALALMNEPL